MILNTNNHMAYNPGDHLPLPLDYILNNTAKESTTTSNSGTYQLISWTIVVLVLVCALCIFIPIIQKSQTPSPTPPGAKPDPLSPWTIGGAIGIIFTAVLGLVILFIIDHKFPEENRTKGLQNTFWCLKIAVIISMKLSLLAFVLIWLSW